MSEAPVTLNNLVLESALRIANMAPGSLITHLLLAEMLRLDRKVASDIRRYYQAIAKLKRVLQEQHQVFLTVVPKKGYLIPNIGKEIDVCAEGFRTGVRRIARAVQSTNNINLARMTDDVRNATVERIQVMANVCGMLMNASQYQGLPTGA